MDIFNDCYYVWGGYPNHYANCTSIDSEPQSAYGRPSDCSGFISWAWGLGSHYNSSTWNMSGLFGAAYENRNPNGSTISEVFPGIQPGDVLVRWQGSQSAGTYQGHVALYIGNNQLAELYTGRWRRTENNHGSRITSTNLNFMGYTKYSESFSGTYDDEEDDWLTFGFTGGGSVPSGPQNAPFPDGSPGDISDAEAMFYGNWQYTKKYSLMKAYRRG